ncbi:MAG: hypothetical protein NTW25_01675 [Candidatus Kapabacteria bacterium]|nr:hypothetical protein [Candidatus Kapabacteria bacterium]
MNNSGGLAILNFNGNSSVSFSGSPVLNDLYLVGLIKSNNSSTVSFLSAFSATSSFLTISGGLASFEGNYTLNNTLLSASGGVTTIPSTGGLSILNPNVNVLPQNANIELSGILSLSSGTFNVGNTSDNSSLFYESGSRINIDGAKVNIQRALSRVSSDNGASVNFSLNSGTINVGIGRTSISNRGVFDIGNSSSTFSWTNGSIYINQNSSAFSLGDYYVFANSGTVTGGNLFFQPNLNSDVESAFNINSKQKIFNLLMVDDNGSRNPKLDLVGNSATVSGTMTLLKRGINSNNLDIYLGGDLINNTTSSLTGFTTGSGTFSFIDGNTQYISGSTSTTFNNIYFKNC